MKDGFVSTEAKNERRLKKMSDYGDEAGSMILNTAQQQLQSQVQSRMYMRSNTLAAARQQIDEQQKVIMENPQYLQAHEQGVAYGYIDVDPDIRDYAHTLLLEQGVQTEIRQELPGRLIINSQDFDKCKEVIDRIISETQREIAVKEQTQVLGVNQIQGEEISEYNQATQPRTSGFKGEQNQDTQGSGEANIEDENFGQGYLKGERGGTNIVPKMNMGPLDEKRMEAEIAAEELNNASAQVTQKVIQRPLVR